MWKGNSHTCLRRWRLEEFVVGAASGRGHLRGVPHEPSANRTRALTGLNPSALVRLGMTGSDGETPLEVPGYEMFGWYSLVAPTGTPQDVLAKASAEVVKAVKEPAFGEQLKGLGIEIAGSSRAELDAFRADQTRRISELVKASGVDIK